MIRRRLLPLLASGLASFAGLAGSAAADTRLAFVTVTPDGVAAPSSMVVSDGWLRIDDDGPSGYVLFDRATRTIYSVNLDGGQIIVIPPAVSRAESPLELRFAEHTVDSDGAPEIGGVKPVHLAFAVNERVCYQAVVVPGLLEDARRAESEYLAALAAEQRGHVAKLPVERLDGCDLGRHVFAADRHLRQGYPILILEPDGSRRELVDYRSDLPAEPGRFELPAGLERIDMGLAR